MPGWYVHVLQVAFYICRTPGRQAVVMCIAAQVVGIAYDEYALRGIDPVVVYQGVELLLSCGVQMGYVQVEIYPESICLPFCGHGLWQCAKKRDHEYPHRQYGRSEEISLQ